MKNNEEKKKFAPRIRLNVFDVLLVLLAILCVVGVWQRHNLQKLFESDETLEAYTVTFEVRKMRSTTANLLQKDTMLYLEDDGERVSLGALAERVSASAATVYLQDQSGNTVKAVYPQDEFEYLLDVNGTLNCRGVMHNGTFLLEGKTYLAVNSTVMAHTETADFEIRIVGIEKVVAEG